MARPVLDYAAPPPRGLTPRVFVWPGRSARALGLALVAGLAAAWVLWWLGSH